MKKNLIVLLLLLSCLDVFAASKSSFSILNLDGDWNVYINKTPSQVFAGAKDDGRLEVPGFWNKKVLEVTGKNDPKVYGCFKTTIVGLEPGKKYAFLIKEQPPTSCAVYINQEQISVLGDPFYMSDPNKDINDKHSHSKGQPVFGEFYTDSNGNAEILVYIANYFYRKSGLMDSVLIGPTKDIQKVNSMLMFFYSIVSGILVFIGLLTFLLFFINKKNLEYLYLTIIAIVCALRVMCSGYCSIGILFPSITLELKYKLEYLILWVLPICIIQMLCTLYPLKKKRKIDLIIRYSIIGISSIFGILAFVLPIVYGSKMVNYLQVCMGLSSSYALVYIIINIIRRSKHISYYFVSISILIIGGGIDLIYTKMRSAFPLSVFPFFLAVFVIIQIFHLAVVQNDLFKQTIKATDDLKVLNEAYLRFVPKEFLKLLNEDSIINVKLGDFSRIEMPIIFSKFNIHSAIINKEITPEEHFTMFNKCLNEISPIIKQNNGFVTKFLSGGFMALFPKSDFDSIKAGLEILQVIEKLNLENSEYIVKPHVGIHYGKMIIGTIGEENRLDDTVISDTVNTSARIESVCEQLNKKIIISQSLYSRLKDDLVNTINFTELDAINVKGKNQPLTLYEVAGVAK